MPTNLETIVQNSGKDIDLKVDFADGKYTYIRYKQGGQEALRYGEKWRDDLAGDNLIYYFGCEVEKLQAQLTATKAKHLELEKHLRATNKGAQTNAIVNQIVTKTNIQLQDRVNSLVTEMKELERDKERLDWLEENFSEVEKIGSIQIEYGFYIKGYIRSTIRSAIDAAQLSTEK